jgi:hypothetical protein
VNERILTPEEVEAILESVDGVDSLVATLRFHERRAIQTRQLADDYKRLVESAHEDTDAARRWSRAWKEGWRKVRAEVDTIRAENTRLWRVCAAARAIDEASCFVVNATVGAPDWDRLFMNLGVALAALEAKP